MAFANASGRDLYKLGLVLHVFNGRATAIAHAGAHATGHLVNDGDHGAFVGHTTLNAFGHQLVGIRVAGRGLLKVAVGTALLHGTNASHAPVAFVAAALKQDDFARCFFGTGKHATHHHRAGPCGQCFGNVAAVANAAIGNQGNPRTLECGGHVVDGHDLGHAYASHNTGGANAARANAHFDAIGACLHQCQCRSTCGDVAANYVNIRVIFLDPTHTIKHTLAVAVGSVNHDGVNAGTHQRFNPLFRALAYPNGRANTQFPLAITCGIGKTGLLSDVFDSDQALKLKRVVNYQQAFQFVLVQQRFGLQQRGAIRYRHQLFARRHDLTDGDVVTGFKAQVAPGDDAYDLAAVADRKA